MNRVLHIAMVFAAFTGSVFAQTTSSATTPAAAPGPGRGALGPVVIGPPAPVPPEVAIPRPTPMELTQVNQAVKRLIDADQSSAQPLLQKFAPLLTLQTPRLNVAATYTRT